MISTAHEYLRQEELEVAEEELDQLVRENTRVNAGSSYSFC